VTWLEEVIAGLGAGIVAVVLVMLWLAPSTIIGFLPKLWRTWKGKRISP
jgi:membrane-associated phospholipid phosphatase